MEPVRWFLVAASEMDTYLSLLPILSDTTVSKLSAHHQLQKTEVHSARKSSTQATGCFVGPQAISSPHDFLSLSLISVIVRACQFMKIITYQWYLRAVPFIKDEYIYLLYFLVLFLIYAGMKVSRPWPTGKLKLWLPSFRERGLNSEKLSSLRGLWSKENC